MRYIFIALICTILSCNSDKLYIGNEPIYRDSPITVEEALLKVNQDRIIQIEGTVLTVCKEEGCWLTIKDQKNTLKIVFSDPSMVVPTTCEGKHLKAEGIVSEIVLSKDEAIQHAIQSKQDTNNISGKTRIPIFTVSTLFKDGVLDD